MLEGASIICFAKDWGGDPTSSNHIMRILSEKNHILWVNSLGMRRPAPNARDLKRLVLKLARGLRGCVRAGPNVHVLSPLVIPLPGFAPVVRLNNLLLSRKIRAICRRLGMRRPILWSFLPYVAGLVGKLDECAVVYHCVDDNAEFPGVKADSVRRAERDLMKVADLIFATSETLWTERLKYNSQTFFVPHGVDLAHFSRALDPDLPIPEDIARLPRPVVGFFGLIADWIDLDMIADAARARPEWSFILIGRCITDVRPLTGLPNVLLLGQRPYDSLPAYCRGFDVGVIPFRLNNLTRSVNPLKLREYLAAGLPVVSTPLPEVVKYSELIRVARGSVEFLREIEQALQERHEPLARHRVAAMRSEGWESRVEEISRHIAERLAMRTGAT